MNCFQKLIQKRNGEEKANVAEQTWCLDQILHSDPSGNLP